MFVPVNSSPPDNLDFPHELNRLLHQQLIAYAHDHDNASRKHQRTDDSNEAGRVLLKPWGGGGYQRRGGCKAEEASR